MRGEMVVGTDGGTLAAAPVTHCAPATPHVLFVMKKGDQALEVRLDADSAMRLARSLATMSVPVKNAETAVLAGYDPPEVTEEDHEDHA